ncbi:MAG: TetR/AcrR family transcriptional regulator [Calditrichia bacterium]
MKKDTREHIIQVGAEMVHKQGFNHTGLKEILDKAGVPKGSFYHYFKSKDDFGKALLDFYIQFYKSHFVPLLEDEQLSPLSKLRKFYKDHEVLFESMNYQGGCPIGNLALEMSDINDSMRSKIEWAFSEMKKTHIMLIEEAQKVGEINTKYSPGYLADFIINSWEGAILRMKAIKNIEPMKQFYHMIFNELLG